MRMSEKTKIKTCIIGDMSVGKTSIILRIHDNEFKEKTVPTTGVDYNRKEQIINGETVNIQLWDTTGQDRFRNVVSNFFRGAHGIFLTFDITNEKSLLQLQTWIKQLNSVLDSQVPKILLANKIDLKPHLTPKAQEIVKQYCEEHNMQFFMVSAKTGANIDEAYKNLVEKSYTYYYSQKKDQTVPVIINDQDKPKKRRCC